MIKYEMKMILRNKTCRLIFTAITIFIILLVYLTVENHEYIDKKGHKIESLNMVRRLANDKNRWKGELTSKLIKDILKKEKTSKNRYHNDMIAFGKEKQSYNDIILFANKLFYGEHADDDDPWAVRKESLMRIDRIYARYRKNLSAESREYGKTQEGSAFMLKQFQKIRMPVRYEAFEAWKALFSSIGMFALVLLVAGVFLSTKILAQEFQYQSASVFFSAIYGKTRGVKWRILTNLLVITVLYWAGISLLSLICFWIMGAGGGQTMFQFDQPYSVYIVTYSQMCEIAAICGYVASMLAASIAMLIVAKTRKVALAFILPIILFLVTPFIVNAIGVRNAFIPLLPHNLTDIVTCSVIPYIYQVGKIVFRQIPFVLLIYSAITILLISISYRLYKNTVVYN